MDTLTGSDADVIITLSAQNADYQLPYPQRRFYLNRTNGVIHLGRASKVISKGRSAAENNALFDSPVMSRDHADLIADVDAKTLSVKDTGSTHGTFLNNESIPKSMLHKLNDGDHLRFGIAINRGAECYTPITLKVGIVFPQRRAVTYEVPDASESELDEAEDILTDEDIVPPTKTLASDQIDLTQDSGAPDSCTSQRHYVVDLTSPMGSPSPSEAPAPAEHLTQEAHYVGSLLGLVSGDFPPETEADDEDFEDRDSIWLSEEEAEDDVNDSDVNSSNSNEPDSESGSGSDEHSEEYDSDMDSVIHPSEDPEDRFLWDDADSDVDETHPDNEKDQAWIFYPTEIEPVDQAQQFDVGNAPVSAVNQSGPFDTAMAAREPSPSDAVLPIPARGTIVKQNHAEFLAAREENKVKAASNEDQPVCIKFGANRSLCSFTETLSATQNSAWNTQEPLCILPPLANKSAGHVAGPFSTILEDEDVNGALHFQQEKQAVAAATETATPTAPLSSGPSALRRTHLGIKDIVERASPEQAKVGGTSKRKAAAISEVSVTEQCWADKTTNHPEEPDQGEPSMVLEPTRVAANVTSGGDMATSSPSFAKSSTIIDAPRPAKRLRAFATRMGYAALGGITVGAVMLSSLALTAPEL